MTASRFSSGWMLGLTEYGMRNGSVMELPKEGAPVVVVNIALGNLPTTACPAFDCCTGCNVGIMLDCILATVNNALNGCPV